MPHQLRAPCGFPLSFFLVFSCRVGVCSNKMAREVKSCMWVALAPVSSCPCPAARTREVTHAS
eukprot:2071988-Rhodomonas_salina.1